jgi:hypothetical protein
MARFAYADPPSYGCGARCYQCAEWDQQATHLDLRARLTHQYPDRWALSTRSTWPGNHRPAPVLSGRRLAQALRRAHLPRFGAGHLPHRASQHRHRSTESR